MGGAKTEGAFALKETKEWLSIYEMLAISTKNE